MCGVSGDGTRAVDSRLELNLERCATEKLEFGPCPEAALSASLATLSRPPYSSPQEQIFYPG